ncbi:MAG TPA: LLM class flavin-dependent oxidoreductase [Candidatus Binatia bacterium]|jgi:alkanesulfonate monooxygenase SsuD/methylene tetrahydromethanopterin reductase-like flavin-dependent oxidoreductase (luciferase family)
MKIGVQLNPQVSIEKPAASLMGTLIEQVRVADQVGFDAFSMGDHYNIPGLQRLNQIPALARLCAEGKRCGVGTAVTLLGLRHPVTVASELASLDVINGGKSFAAFGLGYRQEELNAFHLTRQQRFNRFIDGVEVIRRLWTEDHVSYQGNEIRIEDVSVDPKPLQKPRPPIWIAATSDAMVKRAATIGDGWIIGPHSAIDELDRQVDLCRKAWSAAGKSGAPALPIIRETFVAKTRKEAVEKARPCLEQLYRSIYLKWKQNEAMSDPSELSWAFDRLAKGRFILGSPEECIDQIREYETRLGIHYMLPRFDWTPGLNQAEILAAMRLFGEKVIQKL